jgi:hypothetical protein
MQEAIITGIVFFSFYKIIELFVRLRERRLMIDKMSQVSPETLQTNINSLQTVQKDNFQRNQFVPLRLGAAAIGIGVGLLIGVIIKGNMLQLDIYRYQDTESALIATTALCAGIALIIVYFIERKVYKEAKNEE